LTSTVNVWGSVEYFRIGGFLTDASLIPDPYPYFDHLRARCPVTTQSEQGVVTITGHREALAVYKDPAFSSCVSVAGPFSGLPFEPEGDDIGELIEAHRSQIPMSEHIVTQDARSTPEHEDCSADCSRPSAQGNEDFMWRLADAQLDEFVSRGSCEFLDEYARPFSGLVIADLLGVSAEDHEEFRAVFSARW